MQPLVQSRYFLCGFPVGLVFLCRLAGRQGMSIGGALSYGHGRYLQLVDSHSRACISEHV
jgi:hypothetical protein